MMSCSSGGITTLFLTCPVRAETCHAFGVSKMLMRTLPICKMISLLSRIMAGMPVPLFAGTEHKC